MLSVIILMFAIFSIFFDIIIGVCGILYSRCILYLRCFAGFWIRLCYCMYLFENLPLPVKHEFYLASSFWKFGQSLGIHLQWGPNIAKQSMQIKIFQRHFRKCWLREALKSPEKFLSSTSFLPSISIPITMYLSRLIETSILFLPQQIFKTKTPYLGVWKKY